MVKKPILKVVIDRAKHLNAEMCKASGAVSMLLSHNPILPRGSMCCLGFACEALGIPRKNFRDVGMPSKLIALSKRQYAMLESAGLISKETTDSSYTASRLAGVNDNQEISNYKREKQIIELGRKINIEFSFVGKYPDYDELARKCSE